METQNTTGKTKDQGWEIGVRRTFAVDATRAWEVMMTQPGLGYWFGDDPDVRFKKDAQFATSEGIVGHVVSIEDGKLLRLRWQPRGWDEASTLQLRFIAANDKTTISIHHERLMDAAQREAMKKHWSGVLESLSDLF